MNKHELHGGPLTRSFELWTPRNVIGHWSQFLHEGAKKAKATSVEATKRRSLKAPVPYCTSSSIHSALVIMLRSLATLASLTTLVKASPAARSFLSNRALHTASLSGSSSLFALRGGSTRSKSTNNTTDFVKLSNPAPGSPFHYAFPVHDLAVAKHFYGNILGCSEGRSSDDKWQDYSLGGHQIVCHFAGSDYRCQDYYNPVDGDEVPVPHMGLALTVEEFHKLAERVRRAGIKFIIEPTLRFEGEPGEQWTMFFKDPSGNNLEFKAMKKQENLFAKYSVED